MRGGKLGVTVRGSFGFGNQQRGAEQCSARVGLSLTGKKAESGVGAASEFGSEVRKSSERPLGKQFGSLGTREKGCSLRFF